MWTFLNNSLEFRAKQSVNPAWPHPSVWGLPFWRVWDSLEPEETISGWDEAAGEDPNWIWLRTRGHNLVMSCQSKGGQAFKHSLLYLLFYSKWKHNLLNVVYSQWAQPYSHSHRFGSCLNKLQHIISVFRPVIWATTGRGKHLSPVCFLWAANSQILHVSAHKLITCFRYNANDNNQTSLKTKDACDGVLLKSVSNFSLSWFPER